MNPIERSVRIELPCGRYAFDAIRSQDDLTFEIQGRVHLYIEGDIRPEGRFDIVLAPGAELDLYLGGTLVTGNAVDIGDPHRPNALRWYVEAANQTLSLTSRFDFSGHLYAPGSDLILNDPGNLIGTLFIKNLNTQGAVELLVPETRPQCAP